VGWDRRVKNKGGHCLLRVLVVKSDFAPLGRVPRFTFHEKKDRDPTNVLAEIGGIRKRGTHESLR
jgi:hypothetical protein